MAGYVLIVESDAELQRQIGAALREAGFELHAEAEAAWAKRTVGTRVPDVVVVDTRLTDGDGFAFADELRQAPETRATPIVFVASTHRGVSHRAEARRRFAPADYLPTPLDLARLAPRVAELAANGSADTSVDVDLSDEVTPPPTPKESLRDPAQQRERRDVERSAKSLAADADDAELQGTLKRTPFARLLQRLYAKRATGSLLLLRDTTKKIVMFAEGYPVSVRSNVLGETLGRILLQKRLITSEILAESVGRMQKEKRHQGEILVEMGALSPFNLERALVEQVEAKLFEVFSWSDGKFMFKAGDAAVEQRRLERSPAATILEGIRLHYDEARQQAALDKYAHQYVGLTSDPLLRLQDMTSDPVELAFIQSIDGTRQLEVILDRAEILARQGAPAAGGAVGGRDDPAPGDHRAKEGGAACCPGGVVDAGAGRARRAATHQRAAGERPAVDDAADRPHAGLLLGAGRRTGHARRRHRPRLRGARAQLSRRSLPAGARGGSQDGAGDLRQARRGAPHAARSGEAQELPRQADAFG